MGSHYVCNIVSYIHVTACSIIYGLQILDLRKCRVVGNYVNLKKSVSAMYAGLKSMIVSFSFGTDCLLL
jgi:hypothetical protein